MKKILLCALLVVSVGSAVGAEKKGMYIPYEIWNQMLEFMDRSDLEKAKSTLEIVEGKEKKTGAVPTETLRLMVDIKLARQKIVNLDDYQGGNPEKRLSDFRKWYEATLEPLKARATKIVGTKLDWMISVPKYALICKHKRNVGLLKAAVKVFGKDAVWLEVDFELDDTTLKSLKDFENLEMLKLHASGNQLKLLPKFRQLETLEITGKIIRMRGNLAVKSLKPLEKYSNLKKLVLNKIGIMSDGLKFLPKNLISLEIDCASLKSEDFLQPLSNLKKLVTFSLVVDNNVKVPITPKTIKFLPDSISELEIAALNFGDRETELVKNSFEKFKNLKKLSIKQGRSGSYIGAGIMLSFEDMNDIKKKYGFEYIIKEGVFEKK